ncbi:MAG: response regulator [Opitutaceae bacterium]|nr:response regulator [Opitutaceae bacterium]
MPRPTTALIVDDEPHVRAYVRTLLQELGLTTFWEAAHGDEVMPLVAANAPGIVLLDVNLPGKNGLQVLEQILAAHPEVPVVMVTAQNSMETAKQAAALGASGYILKHSSRPAVLIELRELIESLDEDETE